MKKVGLYFGSFNPVHIGHMAIANYMVEFSDLDQLWFVVSPQNPFKKKKTLLADYHRLQLINLAIGDSKLFKASNIEFSLPHPSYTIDTLIYLKDKYPEIEFVLIIGSDNLATFNKWKNYQVILDNHDIYVYPRPGTLEPKFPGSEKFIFVNAPLIEISSSFIRKSIKQGNDISFFMPDRVSLYIKEMHFYEK